MSARRRLYLSQAVHEWLDQADIADVVHVQQALFRLLDDPGDVPIGPSQIDAGPWVIALFLTADMPWIQVRNVHPA